MDDDKSTRQYFEPPLKVAEIDLAGTAFSHGTVDLVEFFLRPLAQLMSHVDIHLLRVSVDHLNEARKDHQKTAAERYNAQVRAIVVDKNNQIVLETPFFAACNFEVRLDYRDDTTKQGWKQENVECKNCGAWRAVNGTIIEKCRNCGDDETDLILTKERESDLP